MVRRRIIWRVRQIFLRKSPCSFVLENLTTAAAELGVDLAVQLTAESILLSFSDDIAPTLPLLQGDWETVHLANLYDIYRVHDAVAESKITIDNAIQKLIDLSDRNCLYSKAFIVLVYGLTCACIAPPVLSARLIDLPIIFCSGFSLGLIRVYLTPLSQFKDVLDILLVGITSFLARLVGSVSHGQICFSAFAQAPLVIIIPGYTVGK